MNIIECVDLRKEYLSGENIVNAVDGITVAFEQGEFCAITGPSGSGKSTLLHLIGGVDKPTSGKVFVNGEDVYKQSDKNLAVFRRRHVGLIYQFYNLIPILSVRDNITLPMQMDGRKPDMEKLMTLAEKVGIADKLDALPSQLSGGQQQRVSICRALFSSPSVLLADEPTGNLDSKNSREIIELLRASNKDLGQTMLIITHDEDIALQCDRIIAIEDGRIIRDEVVK